MGMPRFGVHGGVSTGGCMDGACAAVLVSWQQAGRSVRDVEAVGTFHMEYLLADSVSVCHLVNALCTAQTGLVKLE